jgi:glyoxylase-like metal-dependent hydrolase (beta-lactamase superfamily II)
VHATASAIEQVLDVWGDDGRLESYMSEVREHLRRNGLPDAIASQLANDHLHARAAIDLAPDSAWLPIEDGAVIEAGGRSWRVVAAPGHSDGQIVLHDEVGGLLLSADHLLERISPAVGKFPRHEADPLRRYIESLDRVADLAPVELVLPGHGAPFRGARDRALTLIQHHERRIDACIAAVAEAARPVTAYDVATVVFAKVFDPSAGDPDAASIRFATTETLAHLEHARFDGRVAFDRDDETTATYVI